MRPLSIAPFVVGAVLSLCASHAALAEPPRATAVAPAATTNVSPAALAGRVLPMYSIADCANVAPDATTVLTADAGIQQFSQPGFGHPPSCTAWVTDFVLDQRAAIVSSHYSPDVVLDGWDYVREVQLDGTLGQYQYGASNVPNAAACARYSHQIMVWRKRAGETAFTPLGGGTLTPSWNQAGLGWGPLCMLKPGPNFKMIPRVTPPSTGADTYRVAIQIAGAPGQVIDAVLHPTK